MGFIEDIERLASWEWGGEDCWGTNWIKCKGRSSDLYFGVIPAAKHPGQASVLSARKMGICS